MKKTFCDCCSAEITSSNRFDGTVTTTPHTNAPAVMVSIVQDDPKQSGKDWCKYCVFGAVQSLDDRPTRSPSRPQPDEPAF